MSDDKEFLVRRSRRKLEAKQGSQAELDTPELVEAKSGEPAGGPAAELADLDVNLSTLPPIDSIEAATDITTFLGKGIPSELAPHTRRCATSLDATKDYSLGLYLFN